MSKALAFRIEDEFLQEFEDMCQASSLRPAALLARYVPQGLRQAFIFCPQCKRAEFEKALASKFLGKSIKVKCRWCSVEYAVKK